MHDEKPRLTKRIEGEYGREVYEWSDFALKVSKDDPTVVAAYVRLFVGLCEDKGITLDDIRNWPQGKEEVCQN